MKQTNELRSTRPASTAPHAPDHEGRLQRPRPDLHAGRRLRLRHPRRNQFLRRKGDSKFRMFIRAPRPRRQKHLLHQRQQRGRLHAGAPPRRPHSLHPMGVRRPRGEPHPEPLDRQPRRHRRLRLLGQPELLALASTMAALAHQVPPEPQPRFLRYSNPQSVAASARYVVTGACHRFRPC